MRGAIFDLDGTLVDSMGLWETAVDRWLTERGEAPLPGLRQTILRMSLAEAAAYLRDAYALRETADELVADMIRFMQRDYATRVELKPGVRAFLTRLRAAGVACCVATAGSRTLAEAALRANGVADCFVGMVTCLELGSNKHEPDVYEAALRLLDLPKSDVVVFEDAYHAAKTAKNAGFRVVGVYDTSEPEQEKLRGIAERIGNEGEGCAGVGGDGLGVDVADATGADNGNVEHLCFFLGEGVLESRNTVTGGGPTRDVWGHRVDHGAGIMTSRTRASRSASACRKPRRVRTVAPKVSNSSGVMPSGS